MDRETRTTLLVDGSASSLFYIGMLLKRLEYKVLTAGSAEDALKQMEGALPSIILTETALPAMSGVAFVKRIKESSRLAAIPIVVLTATVDPALKEGCMRLGCREFLIKPVEPDVLYRALQKVSETLPRQHIRISTSLKIIVDEAAAARTEYATALSEGGLFVSTLYPKSRDSIVPVRLFVDAAEIKARAVVLYSTPAGQDPSREPGMGMKFVEISDADRELIRKYITRNVTKGLSAQGTGA